MRLLPNLPLLSKELIEQSVRRRTYILRSVYALVLITGFALIQSQYKNQSMGMLGSGRELFEALIIGQSLAIMVIMPALSAGSIIHEKEEGSLTILLLTSMGPWELLLQKWLSRLVVVGSYLLLGLPLLGISYAYGGLSSDRLLAGFYVLVLTCLQTSAVALAMSAWFRSSVSAFIATYVTLALLYSGGFMVYEFAPGLGWMRSLLPQYVFFDALSNGVVAASIPILGSIVVFIGLARVFFVRRAHVTGSNPVLRLFRRLDGLFERGDAALGRRRRHDHVPVTDPVAWREFNRRSLANWRYLLRILLPVIAALVIGLRVLMKDESGSDRMLFATTLLGMVALMVLLLVVLSASLVAGERVNQTIDVLLTTPISARDILAQKVRGLRRLHIAMASVIGIVVAFRYFGDEPSPYSQWSQYRRWSLPATVASLIVLPAVISWFGIWIGLRIRNRNRAVIVAVLGAGAWILSVVALALLYFALDVNVRDNGTFPFLSLFATPAALLVFNELEGFRNDGTAPILVFCVWHAFLWWRLRARCLRGADRYLGSQSARSAKAT